jgi:hypothetical protein
MATDGERYTRAEFYEFYGGDAEWEMAGLGDLGDIGGLALELDVCAVLGAQYSASPLELNVQQTPAQAPSAVPSSAWLGGSLEPAGIDGAVMGAQYSASLGGSLEPAGIDGAHYNAIATQIEAERLRMRTGAVLGAATAEEYEHSARYGASVPPGGGEGARHGARGLSELLGSLGDLLNATAEIANLPPQPMSSLGDLLNATAEIANLPPQPMSVPPPEAPSRAPPHLQPHDTAAPGAARPLQPVAARPPLAEEVTSSPAAALFADLADFEDSTMPAAPGAATDAYGWGAYPYLWGTSTSATYEGY